MNYDVAHISCNLEDYGDLSAGISSLVYLTAYPEQVASYH